MEDAPGLSNFCIASSMGFFKRSVSAPCRRKFLQALDLRGQELP
jgi:hypothetical protein